MVEIISEKEKLMKDIRIHILSQKKTFVGYSLAKEWFREHSRNLKSKETSIITYFSRVCNELLNENTIEFKAIAEGHPMPSKEWTIIKK